MLFSPDTLNPQHATFLNVSFGSSYDADDTHVGAMLHPGVAAWSAALATAEHVGASGSEMLAAVVAGYETIIRIGLSMQPGHFRRGFQSTGTATCLAPRRRRDGAVRGQGFGDKDAERKITRRSGLRAACPAARAVHYSGSSGKRIQAAHSGAMRRRRVHPWLLRTARHPRKLPVVRPRLWRRL